MIIGGSFQLGNDMLDAKKDLVIKYNCFPIFTEQKSPWSTSNKIFK